MEFHKLSREEKEEAYRKKASELEVLWGRSPITDTDFLKEWTDDELVDGFNHINGQVKFEHGYSYVSKSILYIIIAFVTLGIFGLLLFGIKQIF